MRSEARVLNSPVGEGKNKWGSDVKNCQKIEHQLVGSGHEVKVRSVSTVECFSPFSTPVTVAESAESNQSCFVFIFVFCQVNNRKTGERVKRVKRSI